MRVLLVEDEVRLADNLATALRDGPGFAVDWAEDGLAGDDFARTPCYDLIVLDLMLPKLDGLSLLKRLRDRRDATPVLILTAKDGAASIIELLNAGADDYLAKPVLAETLRRFAVEHLSIARAATDLQACFPAPGILVCVEVEPGHDSRFFQIQPVTHIAVRIDGSIGKRIGG